MSYTYLVLANLFDGPPQTLNLSLPFMLVDLVPQLVF